MALFRVDFCGRGELADRQQKLAQMLSRLQKLSEGENYVYDYIPIINSLCTSKHFAFTSTVQELNISKTINWPLCGTCSHACSTNIFSFRQE